MEKYEMKDLRTVSEVAQELRLSEDTILCWIKSRKLFAFNISTKRRPIYRIPLKAIEKMVSVV